MKNHRELENLRKQYYFMRFGEKISSIEDGVVLFDPFAHRYIDTSSIDRYTLSDEKMLDRYLRGELLECERDDGPVIVSYQDVDIALEEISGTILSNQFPYDWRRK